MSWSLSSLRFSIVHMVVPSGLWSVVCVGLVGCWDNTYAFVGCVSRSGLIGVVENVRLVERHPSAVSGLIVGVFLFVRRGGLVRCLYASMADGPFSLSMIVESSCHAGPQCTSYRGLPSLWSSGCICLAMKPSFTHVSICSCVRISGVHCVTRYVVWLLRCLWSWISKTSYVVSMVSLGIM